MSGPDVRPVQDRLLDELPRVAAAHHVPGVAMAVYADGQVSDACTGVVNLRTGVPVTPESVFMIQSVTKVWTATLVMQLVDEGLVDLDVPVQRYLPGFRTADPEASRSITARHLLTHTGGFDGDIWAPTTDGDDALERFVDDLVSRAAQNSPPGELYSYCSAGLGVLGRLVEVLRSTTYATALRRHLANPLGLKEIAFTPNEALAFSTAIGHTASAADAEQRPLSRWALMPPSNPAAGNQLAMSVRGLLAFGAMHVADGLTADGTRILSSGSARAMRERQVDHPESIGATVGQGLGWFLPGPDVAEHGGGDIGVAALLRIAPERGVAVAMLTNGGDPGGLVTELVDPIMARLAGTGPDPALPRPPKDHRVADPERYVGSYLTRPECFEVETDDAGRLWLTRAAREEEVARAAAGGAVVPTRRSELRRVDGDTFVRTDGAGVPTGVAQFLGDDGAGRARFLHTGRAAVRSAHAVPDS